MPLHTVIGSGPLGRETARVLLDQGHQVRLVSRHPRMAPAAGLEQVAATAAD
ncbi:MAG: NAD-binding protein, partial [Spirochaetota bacterium]